MSEYFTLGWWFVYMLWAVIIGGLWVDFGMPSGWSFGQWCMFFVVLGPMGWAIAIIILILTGLKLLWELLGKI